MGGDLAGTIRKRHTLCTPATLFLISNPSLRSGGQCPSAAGNHSALGPRFFHDEGFIIPHSAPGASWERSEARPAFIPSVTDTKCLLASNQYNLRSKSGLVSMVSAGVHRNGSHFHITTEASPHLDGRAVAFGRVVEGMDVVKKVRRRREGKERCLRVCIFT